MCNDIAELNLTGAVVQIGCQRYAVCCEESAAVEIVAAFPLFDPRLGVLRQHRAIYGCTTSNEGQYCQD